MRLSFGALCSWYHGEQARDVCNDILWSSPLNTWLVRISLTTGKLTLSKLTQDVVQEVKRIQFMSRQQWVVAGSSGRALLDFKAESPEFKSHLKSFFFFIFPTNINMRSLRIFSAKFLLKVVCQE